MGLFKPKSASSGPSVSAEAPAPPPVESSEPPPAVQAPPRINLYAGAQGPAESLIGQLDGLKQGITDYDLLFTTTRIICARRGSSGANNSITVALISTAMRASQADPAQRYAGWTFDQIVAGHKRNMSFPYVSITRALLIRGVSGVTTPRLVLWVGRKKLKFEFMGSLWIKNRAELFNATQVLHRALPGRVQVKGK